MFDALVTRIRQGRRTQPFPVSQPPLPELFRGLPLLDRSRCVPDCSDCLSVCPTDAIKLTADTAEIDLGRCLFCPECSRVCTTGVIGCSKDHQLAATARAALRVDGGGQRPSVDQMAADLRRILGRSLKLREVSAGGCNGCEVEANALGNIIYDVSRFGVEYTASPRHADGLFITGPVNTNMRSALLATYEAITSPKIVIAAGACAISGGPYRGHAETNNGVGDLIPVDLYIPGCPPHPYTLLDGIYRFLNG